MSQSIQEMMLDEFKASLEKFGEAAWVEYKPKFEAISRLMAGFAEESARGVPGANENLKLLNNQVSAITDLLVKRGMTAFALAVENLVPVLVRVFRKVIIATVMP